MVRLKGSGYYAVARGRNVGLYKTWPECESQVRGFPNARFKKFTTEAEGLLFIEQNKNRQSGASSSNGVSTAHSAPYTTPYPVPIVMGAMGMQPRQQQHTLRQSNTVEEAGLHGIDGVAASALLSLFAAPSTSRDTGLLQEASRPNAGSRKRHSTLAGDGGVVKRTRMNHSIDFSDASIVYTDGACSKNGRHNSMAGYGVFWGPGNPDNECGPVHGEQTNNRAELLGVIQAINKAIARRVPKLVVRTDSQLLINSMDKWVDKWKTNGWRTADGKAVKNKDLLEQLDALLELIPVKFEHVPGHAGIEGNERADELAREGARFAEKSRRECATSGLNLLDLY